MGTMINALMAVTLPNLGTLDTVQGALDLVTGPIELPVNR
jgi:hypothetical protein